MAGSDVQRMAAWIVTTLAADATLQALAPGGVFDTDAPPGAAYPFVQVYESGNSTARGQGGLRLLVSALFGVKVVTEGRSYDAILDAAERVDALLDGAAGATTDLTVFDVGRESELKRGYMEDGIDYRELGGLYRAIVRAS